jgi:thiol-disulfide isomerase/thioredoxin
VSFWAALLLMLTIVSTTLPIVRAGASVKLTMDDYDEMTQFKTVFIKFFAPWCVFVKACMIVSLLNEDH